MTKFWRPQGLMSYTLNGGRIDVNATSTNTAVECQLCSANLDKLSVSQRQQHYEKHFRDKPQASSNASSSKTLCKPGSPFSWKQWGHQKGQDQFWYPAQSSQPPPNFTPGLIPLLKTHLNKSHAKGHTRRATLCYDRAVLVTRELWDAGWGCGYRNFLILCTALMDQPFQPMYFALLDHPTSPSVHNVQRWIEDAWEAGYDKEGAQQLKKLVGTKKWVGTADLYVAFTFRGIPCNLVDFEIKKGAGGVDILINWVVKYFSSSNSLDSAADAGAANPPLSPTTRTVNKVLLGASPVVVTSHMPFILQHDGHSRVIIGYEVSKTGAVNLLVFDPSRLPNKRLRQAGLDIFSSLAPHHNDAATATSSKRPAAALALSNAGAGPSKRARSDARGGHQENDDEVQIIHDSRDENILVKGNGLQKSLVKEDDGDKVSTSNVLKFFRVDHKKLQKKKDYQILYFPLTNPLTDAQKRKGKDIMSEKIS
ncbi:peptidase family C78-domain-containing protein [Mycena sp. CBHHK59/15]|nr:peptidase family C78-domain-containing protein [Mycena sp. CBHHK59/15]